MSNTSLLGSYGDNSGTSLMFRNRIINGDMRIDQRNAGALVPGALGGIFAVDRTSVGVYGSGSGRMSAQRSNDAPAGFTNSLIATVTTADLAANQTEFEGYVINHSIEGNNVSDLDFGKSTAKTVTLSFWVKASLVGNYLVTLNNSSGLRAYSTTYTVSSANTWEYKTVTVQGDTTGTWLTDNNVGIGIVWGLGGGSGRQATALGSWVTTASGYAVTDHSSCVDFIANAGATIQLTGVQLEAGPTATPFERRPIGVELQMCQRYYETGNIYYTGYDAVYASENHHFPIEFKVEKRGIPVMSFPIINFGAAWSASKTLISYAVSTKSARPYTSIDNSNQHYAYIDWIASAEL